VNKYKCRFISIAAAKYEILANVVKKFASFGKFVRLNLTGQIVEVLDCNLIEIIVNFEGKKLTMTHSDISWATPQEAAAAAEALRQ
jgi:hypothetical protein